MTVQIRLLLLALVALGSMASSATAAGPSLYEYNSKPSLTISGSMSRQATTQSPSLGQVPTLLRLAVTRDVRKASEGQVVYYRPTEINRRSGQGHGEAGSKSRR